MTTTVAPSSSTRPAIAAILAISAAATLFLFWLIYVHPAAALSTQYAFLPALNAILNGLSATALLIGYTFIRSHRIQAHRAAMITAFIFSTLFLVSYIAHHALHGDVRYPHDAPLRMVYLPLLASHIVWRSWRCRWCWSRFSFRSPDASASIARLPAGPFRSGSMYRSPV
jgi:putative membrane protein